MHQALLVIDVQPCFNPPDWQVEGIAQLAPTMRSLATVERHDESVTPFWRQLGWKPALDDQPLVATDEDEYLIASEIEETLARKGAEVVGPAGCVETADELLAATAVQAAVVDLRLGGEMAFDLLDRLADRSVPAVLVTGYDRASIPRPYRSLPFCPEADVRGCPHRGVGG